jgi:hypothetical protein
MSFPVALHPCPEGFSEASEEIRELSLGSERDIGLPERRHTISGRSVLDEPTAKARTKSGWPERGTTRKRKRKPQRNRPEEEPSIPQVASTRRAGSRVVYQAVWSSWHLGRTLLQSTQKARAGLPCRHAR